MYKSIIEVNKNKFYEAIFTFSKNNNVLKFPIERIVEYLKSENYEATELEDYEEVCVLRKGDEKVYISQKTIAFEKIEKKNEEKYKQKIISFIILRHKIFADSTLQNIESAKINLIQNKLRTCVSNMYYALHNLISAKVEYYKSKNDFSDIDELSNLMNKEAFVGHFVPEGVKIFIENIDKIAENDKEKYLIGKEMQLNRRKSLNNPFAWIYPLFFDIINSYEHSDEVELVIEDMATAIKEISLDNIAVDLEDKRANFEKEIKGSLESIQKIINTSDKNSARYKLAVLGGYFSYAYMLRQLGDYDSLFEVKSAQKDIIRWTITSARFVDIFIKDLINYDNIDKKVQTVNASSSREIFNEYFSNIDGKLLTITGIIIEKNFNFIEYVEKLIKRTGYALFDYRGEMPIILSSLKELNFSKNILNTKYKCYITISEFGIFRIDVVVKDHISIRDFRNQEFTNQEFTNIYYLEKFIHKDILEEDFGEELSDSGKIVVGYPINYQNNEYSKLELLLKSDSKFASYYFRNLIQNINKIANDFSSETNLIFPEVKLSKMYNSTYIREPHMIGRWESMSELIDNIIKYETAKINFIIIYDYDMKDGKKAFWERRAKVRVERSIYYRISDLSGYNENFDMNINTNRDIKIHYIKVNSEILNNMYYGDLGYIKDSFKNIINPEKKTENYNLNFDDDEGSYIEEIVTE